MEYITHRKFNDMTISGKMKIPEGAKLTEGGGVISYKGKAVCYTRSENAHQYFAVNHDGNGMKRGRLTQRIIQTLAHRTGLQDQNYQARWDKVWADKICQKYKRDDDDNYWLWNHEFYNAPMFDLYYIARLVGADS